MIERRKRNGRSKVLVATADTDILAIRNNDYLAGRPVEVTFHSRKVLSPAAQFAMQCIERWAMVAAEQDGEDTAGRAKLRRLTAAEIVAHACACADEAFAEFERRGWIAAIPEYQAFVEAVKDAENANE